MDAARPAWPALRVDDWTGTREALQLRLQIVGKLELVSTELVNHWWNVTYEASARGLRTRLMHDGARSFDAEFDLVDHVLVLRGGDGGSATVALRPGSIAEFFAEVVDACGRLGVELAIDARPNELSPAVPFADDTAERPYDAAAARAFWQQLQRIEPVFARWRAGFAGKASPVQLFWGSMDLSCTRFSGRLAPPHTSAPPNCPLWVMQEAESRENAAIGFWSGGSEEGTFYAYVYPEPDGYRDGELAGGRFDESLGEWLLPYREVRDSDDPERTLLAFLDASYERAARLGAWDRALLDIDPDRLAARLHPAPR